MIWPGVQRRVIITDYKLQRQGELRIIIFNMMMMMMMMNDYYYNCLTLGSI